VTMAVSLDRTASEKRRAMTSMLPGLRSVAGLVRESGWCAVICGAR